MIVQYRSDKTGLTYKTEADCLSAEKEWDKAHAKEQEAANKRKTEVKRIEDKANEYLAKLKSNDELKHKLDNEADALYKEYKKLLDSFSTKYHGYHLTYTNTGNNAVKIEESRQEQVADAFTDSQRLLRDWLNVFGHWF